MFAKVKDGVVVQVPYGYGDLMAENPGTVFPHNNVEFLFPETEAATRDGYELVPCRYVLNTGYDRLNFIEDGFEAYQENGEWIAKQKLVPLTEEQKAEMWNRVGLELRIKRNHLLSACDWTQLSDATVDKAAWAAYRQALREVPQQQGYPVTIQWPDAP